MICQECNERPATLHFTKINNGKKTEFHLCEVCAQEKGEHFVVTNTSSFSINNLLAGLLNFDHNYQLAQQKASLYEQQQVLQCESCSMTYKQFIQVGRFGCAHCYETFRDQLQPILRRLHSGNSTHNGKIPKRIGGNIHYKKKVEELKIDLKSAIENEEFEQAAIVRDEIREIEKLLRSESEGEE